MYHRFTGYDLKYSNMIVSPTPPVLKLGTSRTLTVHFSDGIRKSLPPSLRLHSHGPQQERSHSNLLQYVIYELYQFGIIHNLVISRQP